MRVHVSLQADSECTARIDTLMLGHVKRATTHIPCAPLIEELLRELLGITGGASLQRCPPKHEEDADRCDGGKAAL
jgi:hypothetical protein